MSREYDNWVFMQLEPHWEHRPTGRPAKEKMSAFEPITGFTEDELKRLRQQEEEDKLRRIEYFENHESD